MKRWRSIRLDAEVDEAIRQLAGDERGAYSRTVNAALAAYGAGKPAFTPEDRETFLALVMRLDALRRDLAPVGSNLNQIAYHLNAGGNQARLLDEIATMHADLQDRFESIRYVLGEILGTLRRL